MGNWFKKNFTNGRIDKYLNIVLVAVFIVAIAALFIRGKPEKAVVYSPSMMVMTNPVCVGDRVTIEYEIQAVRGGYLNISSFSYAADGRNILLHPERYFIVTHDVSSLYAYPIITIPDLPPGQYVWASMSISLTNQRDSDILEVHFTIAEPEVCQPQYVVVGYGDG